MDTVVEGICKAVHGVISLYLQVHQDQQNMTDYKRMHLENRHTST